MMPRGNVGSNEYNITILDGYTDEPSTLGVPPYIAPLPRYIYGSIKFAHKRTSVNYLTIDEYRAIKSGTHKNDQRLIEKDKLMKRSNLLMIIAGAIVPGKYLRATPISFNEIITIAESFNGVRILGGAAISYDTFAGGTYGTYNKKNKIMNQLTSEIDFVCLGDLDAGVFEFLTSGEFVDRKRNLKELNSWSILGADLVTQHPDYPDGLMLEVEAGSGCVRYYTGGCSFCSEPGFGEPVFRQPEDIVLETDKLYRLGIKNFRLGALSCIFSYLSSGIGESETPKPNPKKIKQLLSGIRIVAPELKVLHLDNANPAVMAAHEKQTKEILRTIVKYCTRGNILSFGLESADPQVISANNLNTDPDEVFSMIKLVNEIGSSRGKTGLPELLPGLNFVYGLPGETKETFHRNLEFLKTVLDSGLMVRRINMRQLIPTTTSAIKVSKKAKYHREFIKHKKQVRELIDQPMLIRVCPKGTLFTDVLIEKHSGNISFGRQLGTYPILVGVPYRLPINSFNNILITDHGYRSITGFGVPFNINKSSLTALQALPAVGKKRAIRIFKDRPYATLNDLNQSLDNDELLVEYEKYIEF